VISFNHKVDVKTAKKLVQIFLEVIAAPNYEVEALKILKTKKNLRVLKLKVKPQAKYSVVSIDGGVLIQTEDKLLYNKLEVVTKTKPTKAQMKDLIFAFKVVKYVRSNAIVVAKNGIALGIGGGQVNRI
jgi:phosphoribosylaminoimidazolecarboxamide formyltransferase/IMP cyclohydrolase